MVKKKKYSDKELLLQPNLFGEDFIVKPVELIQPIVSTELQISNKLKQKLSKQQQKFNQLIKKIENLEKAIEKTKTLGFELNNYYTKHVIPVEKDFGEACFVWVNVLHEFALKFKLTDNQRDKLDSHIIEMCDTALSYIEPNDEQKAFYDSYNYVSYDEKMEYEKQEMMDQFKFFMEDEVGIDFEDMPFDISDAEKSKEFIDKIKAKLENKKIVEEEKQQNQTKTKKQIEKEQQKLLEETLGKKSLRSIYISLAKMLHPDTETDEKLIDEKSELMKKVSSAYEQKDLSALLKLEMEWVHHTTEHLDLLTDDKLGLYNNILMKQLGELQNEHYAVKMNPAYINVSNLLGYEKNYALKILKTNKHDLLHDIEEMKNNIVLFKTQPTKKSLLTNYLKNVELEEEDEDDLLFDYLNDLIYNS